MACEDQASLMWRSARCKTEVTRRPRSSAQLKAPDQAGMQRGQRGSQLANFRGVAKTSNCRHLCRGRGMEGSNGRWQIRENPVPALCRSPRSAGARVPGADDQLGLARGPQTARLVLARYKFVAKMFAGLHNVLEVGCADAFGARVVLQEVGAWLAVDFDPGLSKTSNAAWIRTGRLSAGSTTSWKARSPDRLTAFTRWMWSSIFWGARGRVCGQPCPLARAPRRADPRLPSLQSQAYASPASRAGHVNCRTRRDSNHC